MTHVDQRAGDGFRLALTRLAVRGTRALYSAVEDSPFAAVLRTRAVRWCKSKLTRMPAEAVGGVLDALDAAGCRAWVAGGWGVDALLGRQTRTHYDLDVVIESGDGVEERAKAALAACGFRADKDEFNPGLAMPQRWIMDDDRGHIVDLLPVDLAGPPFSPTAAAPSDTTDAGRPGTEPAGPAPSDRFTRGIIAGREVPCLSATMQLTLHHGYTPRETEPADLRLLRERAALSTPVRSA
ncbi:MAG: nucleotidyltransferase domain-containing protein [Streptosporangiaceae bacterium]